MTFSGWVKDNQNKSKELNDLFKVTEKNIDTWRSVGSLDQAKEAIVNDVGLSKSEKTRISGTLDAIWSDFLSRQPMDSGNVPGESANTLWDTIWNNASAIMAGALLLALGFILYLVYVISWSNPAADQHIDFLARISDPAAARGLITFLFSIATVAVILILTLAAFFSSGQDRAEMKERFDMGKQVLTILIGVFGTILGFYFGSLDHSSPPPEGSEQTTDEGGDGGDGGGNAGGTPAPDAEAAPAPAAGDG